MIIAKEISNLKMERPTLKEELAVLHLDKTNLPSTIQPATCKKFGPIRYYVVCLLVAIGYLMCAVPSTAATISTSESVIIQATIPVVRTSGVVVICESFFTTFGLGCTSPAATSDSLRFIPLTTSTQVNLASDPDTDGLFESPLADSVPVTLTGDTSAIGEGLFGGWSYQPKVATDPGWNPTPGAVQDMFLFAGDPEDAPEPSTSLLLGIGLVCLIAHCWRRGKDSIAHLVL
jgi:hypothetical protein